MKIGLLAYHSACNFGATLQLLSTYGYLTKHGHHPIVINWTPQNLEDYYRQRVPASQFQEQIATRQRLWEETRMCRNSKDVAQAIEENGIEAVIIGSDAVAQHHPLLERIVFPCRTIIGIIPNTEDREYPNPFWATWEDFLSRNIPVVAMSVSCQDSRYRLIPHNLRQQMAARVVSYKYLSVRDTWTRQMMEHLTSGRLKPEVTPDPVFALNDNAGEWIPGKDEIIRKYNLPEKYILLTFPDGSATVPQSWIDKFQELALKDGKECVLLPFSHADSFGTLPHTVRLPLSPTDWYALIKHASAYVGYNMHPIVVALHNQVPFFSFDTYGTKRFNGLLSDDRSSKIRHLLSEAGFSDYRTSCLSRHPQLPTPSAVYDLLTRFDTAKARLFAEAYGEKYRFMMQSILKSLHA
ncbi:MAG: polysaccharide pyruvyl transferase family protein [Prevotella sp.]|nr:polysaccharide pyruvyl transferase family protein [Prevotella sp.]